MQKTYSGNVTKLVLLTSEDLSQDSSHNLTASRLGHVGNHVNGLGGGKRTDALADLHDEFFAESVADLIAVFDGDKGVDGLTRQFIGDTDNGGFGDGVVLDEGGLNLSGRETVSRDVDDVVDTTADPVEAFVVATSSVTGELQLVSRRAQRKMIKRQTSENPPRR